MPKAEVVIFWMRRDLRLNDSAGLSHALQSGLPVLPVFIFDKNILVTGTVQGGGADAAATNHHGRW